MNTLFRFRAIAMLTLLAGCLLTACAGHTSSDTLNDTPARVRDGILVGANDMSLYVFDKDESNRGKSVCNGKCEENWPPLKTAPGATPGGDWTIILRDDGKTRQWAYKGRPLYYWVKDQKPGDQSGDGANNNVWHLARP